MNPRVICAEVLNHHQVLVTFTNQEQRIFDVSDYLTLPVFQVLTNPSYFEQVQVAYGTLSWFDEVDFCPDTVYLKSKPFNNATQQADL
jgi:hypothetical protein